MYHAASRRAAADVTAAKPASPMLRCGVVSYVVLLCGVILVRVCGWTFQHFRCMHPTGELDRKSQFFRLSGLVGNHHRKMFDLKGTFSTAYECHFLSPIENRLFPILVSVCIRSGLITKEKQDTLVRSYDALGFFSPGNKKEGFALHARAPHYDMNLNLHQVPVRTY